MSDENEKAHDEAPGGPEAGAEDGSRIEPRDADAAAGAEGAAAADPAQGSRAEEAAGSSGNPGDPGNPGDGPGGDGPGDDGFATDAEIDAAEMSLMEAVEAQAEALKAEVEALRQELEIKHARTKELEDKHLRLQADFDNYRKRQQREIRRLQEERAEEVLRRVLPVFDSFGRAIQQYEKDSSAEALVEGLEMIAQQFRGFLESHGVAKIEAEGKPFDPNLHDAMVRVPIPDGLQDEDVVEVYEDGFLIGERVLRPAKVSVAKAEA